MSGIKRQASHHLNKPMFGYFTPKSAADSSALRKHFVAAVGEFVGTFLFLFTAYLGRTQVSSRNHWKCIDHISLGHAMSVTFAPDSAPGGGNSNQTVVFIALSYGFSLLIAAWVLYRVSGGLFNPAVTLGMVITGTLPAVRGLVLFPVQILGGICAAAVVSCIIPIDIAITQTTLAPNMNVAQGLFLEMVRRTVTKPSIKPRH
jgi:aquaporin related protein